MKKFLSFLIVAAMLVSVFCFGTSAANPQPEHVIGTHGKNNNVSDGKEDIDTSNNSLNSDVVLKVGTVNHRYAVDVTFDDTYTFNTADVTWDVNSLKYVTSLGDVFSNKTLNITVTNYSDLSVKATGEITNSASDLDDAKISLKMNDAASVTVDAVTVGNGTDGSTVSTTGSLSALLSSTDWEYAVGYLIKNNPDTEYKVGTVTVTIEKADNTSDTPVTP